MASSLSSSARSRAPMMVSPCLFRIRATNPCVSCCTVARGRRERGTLEASASMPLDRASGTSRPTQATAGGEKTT